MTLVIAIFINFVVIIILNMLENKDNQRTSLDLVGSFGLMERIQKSFPIINKSTMKAFGDDASVMDFKTKKTIVATDLLVEGVHFDLAYFPLKHLGYKAVISGISNICAMNALPSQIIIDIAISNRFTLEAVEEFFEGVRLATTFYQIDLVGGKTTSSQKGLIVSVTALGEVKKDDEVYRSEAKDGDLIVLTGDIGAAYMGLQVLEREKQVYLVNPNSQPDLEDYSYIIERQLKPEARVDIRTLLEKLEVKPTAMTNVVNGIAADLLQLSKQSILGCNLYEDKLPLDPQFINVCEEFVIDSTTVAINGGEDYEILFTISINDYDKIKANPNFTVIGHMVSESEGAHLITRENTKIPLKARGWNTIED